MDDEEAKTRKAQPWNPMADPTDIKVVGKLLEELGEAVSAAARCLIQGIEEKEPVTGKPNRDWLEDELADVGANMVMAANRFNLATQRMNLRSMQKQKFLASWHDMPVEPVVSNNNQTFSNLELRKATPPLRGTKCDNCETITDNGRFCRHCTDLLGRRGAEPKEQLAGYVFSGELGHWVLKPPFQL